MVEFGRKVIGLVTFGEVDRGSLAFLPRSLEKILGLPTRWEPSLPIPAQAYHARRRQYLSGPFLEALASMPARENLHLLGITDVDLYTPGLNFIFGQAVKDGRECIVSTARLRPSLYGESDDPDLFRERVIKEAVHELGHTFGFGHCPDPGCVMRFSNSLADTDRKGHDLCPLCRRRYLALQG